MWMRMIKDRQASDDGINLLSFEKGEVYNLSPKLHAMFKREGWAAECREPRAKAEKRAPEDKAEKRAPEDK